MRAGIHPVLLLRVLFGPKDAHTELSNRLIVPLVEKCCLNLWLLVLRSELTVSKN